MAGAQGWISPSASKASPSLGLPIPLSKNSKAIDNGSPVTPSETIYGISLFTGSAQLDCSVHAALAEFGINYHPICYVENDAFAAEVIRARVRDGLIPDAPIWPDVCTFPGSRYRGIAQAVVAGFPCQPFSVAGKRTGTEDERYLFGDVVRTATEAGCELIFMENVPGLLIPDARRPDEPAPIADVSRFMAESGFDCSWLPMAAEDVGAPHGRERWWGIAWGGQHWSTPTVGDVIKGAGFRPSRAATGRTTDYVARQVRQWQTPKESRGGYTRDSGDPDKERATLEGEVVQWCTPSSGKFRTRGGDRADELGLDNQVKNWATPTENDGKNDAAPSQFTKGNGGRNLNVQVEQVEQVRQFGESLNPDWEEILMGWRIGWSDPTRACSGFPGFPMGQGNEQYPYEPPRTLPRSEMKHRTGRIKMCGNGVVPQAATAAYVKLLSLLLALE